MSSSGPLYVEEFREAVRGNPDTDAYAWIVKIITDAMCDGAISIPDGRVELYAQTLWSAFDGLVSLHIGLKKEPWVNWLPMDERVDLMFNLLMVGIIKEPPAGLAFPDAIDVSKV